MGVRRLLALLFCLFLPIPSFAQTQRHTLVSHSASGEPGNGASGPHDVATSATGHRVAFTSGASNFDPADVSPTALLYLYESSTRQVRPIVPVTFQSIYMGLHMSASGRYVAFGDMRNIVIVDVDTGAMETVTAVGPAVTPTKVCEYPYLSSDGRFMTFVVATNGMSQTAPFHVYLYDRTTRSVELIADVGRLGQTARPTVSDDGRYVAFASADAANVDGDTNGVEDVLVRDRVLGTTARISVGAGGVQGSAPSDFPMIDASGAHVVFLTDAPEVDPTLHGAVRSVVVWSRATGHVTRVSPSVQNWPRYAYYCPGDRMPAISADGRRVLYHTADAFHSGTCPTGVGPVVTDIITGTTTRLQNPASGDAPNGWTERLAISGNGRVVVTSTFAGNLTDERPPFAMHQVIVSTCLDPSDGCDSDADSLSDDWEQQFGLDAFWAGDQQGAHGDPDGDGADNVAEWAAGTHPRGFFTRYFAEGASSTFFDTTFALLNPGAHAANVLLRFQRADGTNVAHALTVGASSRATVPVATLAGMAVAEFSTVVESDAAFVADRTMTWDATGYGSHAETGAEAPATTWYLAEGATHSGLDLFYLIQNANDRNVDVRVTYLLPAGAPIEKDYVVGPRSRFNIWVNTDDPRLAGTDVSAVITTSLPTLVERAMYLSALGTPFNAGHDSFGVTAPATEWILAEGATGDYFDLFVLIANPGSTGADVEARFLLPDGSSVVERYTVAARSRFNIWVDTVHPRLADTAVSTVITSMNAVPLIVERSLWWPGPTAATWAEAHNSAGSTTTGQAWALADGEVGGARGVETYMLIANRGEGDVARVTLFYEDGTTESREVALPANSRTNVAVASDFPNAVGRRFGAVVEALGLNPQIVVERAMYSNVGGIGWAAGTNAVATKLR